MTHHFFDRPESFGPEEVGPIFLPYPDLAFGQWYFQVNHQTQKVCAGFTIRNVGRSAPGRSFQVVVGINLQANGRNIYSEQIFTIPEDAIIGPGFQTPCSERELVYRDEVPDANYTFYGLIDPNHELIDTNRSNNYNEINWRWYTPKFLSQGGTVRLDVETEPGGVAAFVKRDR
jgi:hypothetical protein